MKHRPSKRERTYHTSLGHDHSPPTNSRAIRKANIQAVLSQSKGIVWRSDTPSVIAKASDKSPFVRAYVTGKGQGQGKPKERITPKDRRKFQGGDDVMVLDGTLLIPKDDKKIPANPERKFRMADTKKGKKRHGFRKFNPTGKA